MWPCCLVSPANSGSGSGAERGRLEGGRTKVVELGIFIEFVHNPHVGAEHDLWFKMVALDCRFDRILINGRKLYFESFYDIRRGTVGYPSEVQGARTGVTPPGRVPESKEHPQTVNAGDVRPIFDSGRAISGGFCRQVIDFAEAGLMAMKERAAK